LIQVRRLLEVCWPCIYDWRDVQLSWLLVVLRVTPVVLMSQARLTELQHTSALPAGGGTILNHLNQSARPKPNACCPQTPAMQLQIDGMMAYQLCVSLLTFFRGIFKQDLVTLNDWEAGELARDFTNCPKRWWSKCMSAPAQRKQVEAQKQIVKSIGPMQSALAAVGSGQQPQALLTADETQDPQTAAPDEPAPVIEEDIMMHCAQWRAFASAWTALITDLRIADLLSDAEVEQLALHDTSLVIAWLEHCLITRQADFSESEDYVECARSLLGLNGEPGGILGPVLLPGFVHVGVARQLVEGAGRGCNVLSTYSTLWQLRAVSLAVLAGMGFITPQEVVDLSRLGEGWVATPL
jgi:hypothetical protein